ncbi:MAG: hypothetical protein ACODAA_00820 [Gemmatimonadota bacterium]
MQHPDRVVRRQFVDVAGRWVGRLCNGERQAPSEESGTRAGPSLGPRQIVNLAHRLSDTLPTDLADRLEDIADEFWTLCQRRWPDGDDRVRARARLNGGPVIGPDELARRLDRLARGWARLERDLVGD